MAGRGPAIHVFLVCVGQKEVGGRPKPGHDSRGNAWVIINERPGSMRTLPAAHSGRIQAAHGAAYVPRPPHEIPMPTRCRLAKRAAPTRNPTAGACPRTSAERWHISDANRRGKARHSPCPKWNERSQGAMMFKALTTSEIFPHLDRLVWTSHQHDRRLMRLSGARRTSQLRLQPIPSQPIRFSSSPTPRFSSPRADWDRLTPA